MADWNKPLSYQTTITVKVLINISAPDSKSETRNVVQIDLMTAKTQIKAELREKLLEMNEYYQHIQLMLDES